MTNETQSGTQGEGPCVKPTGANENCPQQPCLSSTFKTLGSAKGIG